MDERRVQYNNMRTYTGAIAKFTSGEWQIGMSTSDISLLTETLVYDVIMKHYKTKCNDLIVKPTWLTKNTSFPASVLANLIDHIESGSAKVATKAGLYVFKCHLLYHFFRLLQSVHSVHNPTYGCKGHKRACTVK